MVKKRKELQEVEGVSEPIAIEATDGDDNLRTSLQQIREYEGVTGYILRNTHSATIDLKEPARIIEYAILSSTVFDSTEDLSSIFGLGEVKNVVVVGKDAKMLAMNLPGNKVSIFMELNADIEKIVRRIQPQA